jgi:hypothetical protein
MSASLALRLLARLRIAPSFSLPRFPAQRSSCRHSSSGSSSRLPRTRSSGASAQCRSRASRVASTIRRTCQCGSRSPLEGTKAHRALASAAARPCLTGTICPVVACDELGTHIFIVFACPGWGKERYSCGNPNTANFIHSYNAPRNVLEYPCKYIILVTKSLNLHRVILHNCCMRVDLISKSGYAVHKFALKYGRPNNKSAGKKITETHV